MIRQAASQTGRSYVSFRQSIGGVVERFVASRQVQRIQAVGENRV